MQKIPFAYPLAGDEEEQAVKEVLASGLWTHGPQAAAFEEEFAAFLGPGAHCVAVSSGMAALHLAFWRLGLTTGDEVIVAAQNHVATAHAICLLGAIPVFADCEPVSGNIDPSLLECLITPRTKAIALVHFLGIPCDLDAITAIARRHSLFLIEDCALALGARWRGIHAGLHGDAGIFSFYPAKHIGVGEGGMFVTRHADLARDCARARGFGVDKPYSDRPIPGIYDVTSLGLNYRLSDVHAAIGRAQLRKLPRFLQLRQQNFQQLSAELVRSPDIHVLQSRHPAAISAHYCLSAVLPSTWTNHRNTILQYLAAAGIGCSVYYPHPVPRLEWYRRRTPYNSAHFTHAERISDSSVALPVGPHLAPEDPGRIAHTLFAALEESLR